MTTPTRDPLSEGAIVTFPSIERRHGSPMGLRVCRRIGIVRWVNDQTGTVTIKSPENGRTYTVGADSDIRWIETMDLEAPQHP